MEKIRLFGIFLIAFALWFSVHLATLPTLWTDRLEPIRHQIMMVNGIVGAAMVLVAVFSTGLYMVLRQWP